MEVTPPVTPMLAAPSLELPTAGALPGGSLYEPKFDGFRALVFHTDDGVMIQSRRGNDISAAFPDVAAAVRAQVPSGVVLDGELVVLGDDGVLVFGDLQRRLNARPTKVASLVAQRPAGFVAFDVLADRHRSTMRRAFSHRRANLVDLMRPTEPPLQIAPQTAERDRAAAWMAAYAAAPVGLEGVVVKGRDQFYLPGQRRWRKVRVRTTSEVLLAAVTGTLASPGRLICACLTPHGDLLQIGATSEMDLRHVPDLVPLLRLPERPHPWTAGEVEGTLVEPVVIEVAGDQSRHGDVWRHPVTYVRARPDLEPWETVRPPRWSAARGDEDG